MNDLQGFFERFIGGKNFFWELYLKILHLRIIIMQRIITTILLLLLPVLLTAQNYSVKKISKIDGLSNSSVVSIAEDKTGFIWIATEEGLNRFDGNGFETFFKSYNSQNSLSGNELNCILDDPEDSVLWIATQRAGLNAYDYKQKQFSNFPSVKAVTHIAPSRDRSIWISTYWDGIFYYSKAKKDFIAFNEKNVKNWIKGNIWTLEEDFSSGIIYLGYSDKGFAYFDRKNGIFKNFIHQPSNENSLPDNEVLSIYIDENQRVWVGTRLGLALFDKTTEQFKRFDSPKNAVFDIKLLGGNQLWLALELGGISVLDLENPEKSFSIEEKNSTKGLSANSVRCLMPDKYGNIWAGLWNGGLNFINLDGDIFDTYSDESVLAVTFDNDGKLWLGTDGDGLRVIDKGTQTKTFTTKSSTIPSDFIQCAFRDSSSNLWFGFYKNGAAVYNTKTKTFFNPLPKEFHKLDVRSGCQFDKNNILLATNSGILKVDLTGKNVKLFPLPHDNVRCVLRDSYGNIWAGTFGGGVYILDDKFNVICNFDTDNGFPSNTVNHITEDSQFRIWVATGEGLVLFDNRRNFKFTIYNKQNGLFNSHIRAIAEDSEKNIWVSTNDGISCYLFGKGKVKNYSPHYNIPSGEFSSGAVTKLPTGELVFASIKGVCKFLPQNVLSEKAPPKAQLGKMRIFLPPDSLKLNNQRVISSFNPNGVVLKHFENNFSLSFFTGNYAYSGMIEYALKLDGSGKDFYTVPDPENVFFMNIAPGKYTLKIKTRFIGRDFSFETTDLKITILQPWYLTFLAKIFYILTALTIIFFSFKAYKRRVNMRAELKTEKQTREKQEALNEERMRFYTNAAHEIRTPLSLIAGPLEDLASDKNLDEAVAQKINLINRNSRKLLSLVNNLLDLRKTETANFKLHVTKGYLNRTVGALTVNYRELNSNREVEILYECMPGNYEMYFDNQSITTIVNNLLSNALKYTEKGYIKVSLSKNGETAILSVKDTGYGISQTAMPKIFDRYYQGNGVHQVWGTGIGLSLVKNLVELHKGTIAVESRSGQGSKFIVTIPSLEEAAAPEEKTEEIPVEKEQNGKPLVLIVEDNADILEYIKMALTEKYSVLTASNGESGIITAIEKTPEIVVSDIMMPIKDGIELCKTLKKDLRTSHIPIILLTAKDSLEDKTEGYISGADSYITKPFSASLIQSRIANLLEKKRQLAGYFSAQSTSQKFLEGLSATDAEFMKKIDALIEENLSDSDFSVSTVCKKMCISSSTLYRKIKALTLISANEYIKKFRVRKAAAFLEEGRYTIGETVYKVGFGSTDYFRDCFKEEYGVSPSEYIKKIRKK